MNVEGSQWASLSANVIEQAQALVERIPEQIDNFIASVPPALRNDTAAIPGSSASLSFLAPCAIEYCKFPICENVSVVSMRSPFVICLLACMVLSAPSTSSAFRFQIQTLMIYLRFV